MYGTAGDDAPLREDAPLRPLTAYAASKVRAEEALGSSRGTVRARLDAECDRVRRLASARLDIVLNNLVAWAHTTGSIRLLSDGMSWRPLVHVLNRPCRAGHSQGPPEDISGQAFNVGSSSRSIAFASSQRSWHRRLPRCEVTYAADTSPDPRSYRVDFSKFASTFPDCSSRTPPSAASTSSRSA